MLLHWSQQSGSGQRSVMLVRVSIVCQLLIWVFTTFVVLCGRVECVPFVFVLAFWCQELE